MPSIGETLIAQLRRYNVDVLFGIPGVHTLELYRGLAESGIRHITPRHEQGAGFMADGYARVTGKPGVALVITGPGITNMLTPMAQARADSVPLLVISSANPDDSVGRGRGHLHELPDQFATVSTIAAPAFNIQSADNLEIAIDDCFAAFECKRPGPAYIQLPLDIANLEANAAVGAQLGPTPPLADRAQIKTAAAELSNATSPIIIAGGGVKLDNERLTRLAERLDAPVILTTNARGLMHDHPLVIPASPSLKVVRNLIESADCVLALGTELGRTDFDMYETGGLPTMRNLIRVDIDLEQLSRHNAQICLHSTVGDFLEKFEDVDIDRTKISEAGAKHAQRTREAAFDEIGSEMREITTILDTIRSTSPKSIIVGDSTQPIYAGNLYYDHDRPGGWFNASTGYGALGYGIPAAIGAAIGSPGDRVICLCGDGGAQFTLPEMMVAVEENLPIIFIIWNNHGYREIETSMEAAGITVIGCNPTPPDFQAVAQSCRMAYRHCAINCVDVAATLEEALALNGPVMIELEA